MRKNIAGISGLLFWMVVVLGWFFGALFPALFGGRPGTDYKTLWAWTIVTFVIWRYAARSGSKPSSPNQGALGLQKTHLSINTDSDKHQDMSFLPQDWTRALSNEGVREGESQLILATLLSKARSGNRILPERNCVFRAFHLTPIADVKVVILGLDPYPQLGQADGLAFSVPTGEAAPYSLRRIFDNILRDPKVEFNVPTSGNLTSWAQNGVLLLNTALTVEEGTPGSHLSYWRHFTKAVLSAVNNGTTPVVFMLWGDEANALGDEVGLDTSKHKVLRSTHPRQQAESRYPRFADTQPFSEANVFSLSRGLKPVIWKL